MKKYFYQIFLILFLCGNFSDTIWAQKPPIMGWSSWNHFRIHIDEKIIREQADALIISGLYDAGYRFINIDDGYFAGRDAKDNLLVDSVKFPSGMKSLVDYIHAKGLKAGIYSDAGENTCGSIYDSDKNGVGVGLYGHLDQDCNKFFREWGFDFIKVDWCGGEKMNLDEKTEYLKIIRTVKAINPEIVFNICRWKFPGEWAIHEADSWRISGDIRNTFESILHIIDLDADLYRYASAGHYNDMDMLQVGRGMTYDEDKSHFSMWCMLNSPLLAGNDLRNMSEQTIEILTNKEIIALNQDEGFKQAVRIFKENDIEIWKKTLGKNGESSALAILNRGNHPIEFSLTPQNSGLRDNAYLRDLWRHSNIGKLGKSQTFVIPTHGIIVLKTL
jgi:hypothetical protein